MRITITIDTADQPASALVRLIRALRVMLPSTNIEAHDSDTGEPFIVEHERPTEARW